MLNEIKSQFSFSGNFYTNIFSSKFRIIVLRSSNWESPRRYCHFANLLGLGSMSLCHHNISKNPNHDLTLLQERQHCDVPGPYMFGLSIERPILDHHPKAHVHEIRRISPWNRADFTMKSVKSSRFHHEIWRISGEIRCFRNQMQMFQQKLFWFYKVWGGFHLKSAGFHEICWISPEIRRISYGFHVKSKDLCKEL